jgi:hypothetical protein
MHYILSLGNDSAGHRFGRALVTATVLQKLKTAKAKKAKKY